MKTYRARYTPEAARIIRKLHPTIKATIRTGIRDILKDPLLGRELQLDLSGFRSLRVRRYRIITGSMRSNPASRSTMSALAVTFTKASGTFSRAWERFVSVT